MLDAVRVSRPSVPQKERQCRSVMMSVMRQRIERTKKFVFLFFIFYFFTLSGL